MKRPISITACEKLWPGITSLWDSIGDLPRQLKEWMTNFKKNVEWKNTKVESSLNRQPTNAIAFLDLNDDPFILEEATTPKGQFLRISGQYKFSHLSPELAGKLAAILQEYSKNGKLPSTSKISSLLKEQR